nr:methylosome subunit pICln-like isoform X2 [Dermatophagoides farinae]
MYNCILSFVFEKFLPSFVEKVIERCTSFVNCQQHISRFTWRTENGQGFNLEYPQISLHATSRDLNNFHSECLYLMFEDNNNENATQHIQSHIDGDYGYNANVLGDQDNDDNEDEDDDDDEGNNHVSELRFVPGDPSKLDLMYQALSECQLLHPDPDDVSPFGDEHGEFFGANDNDDDDDEEEDNDGLRQRQDDEMERMDYTNGQFEDAQ